MEENIVKSDCTCQSRTAPLTGPCELREGGDPVELIQEHGYFVLKGLLNDKEVEGCREAISEVCKKWYSTYLKTGNDGEDFQEIANRRPAWKDGTWQPPPGQEELGFRKLFRMTLYEKFFADMCKNQKILNLVRPILGPDIKLIQSMCLLKPPGGIAKNWHQDNAYFRLTPNKVLGVWIALDPANCANGCMHMLPKSHESGFYKHDSNSNFYMDYCMTDTPQPNDIMPIVLEPGDAVLFHGHTAHYTPVNATETRRRSVQFHYASSECQCIRCPNEDDTEAPAVDPSPQPGPEGPKYFDCDHMCTEAKYFTFKNAEMHVCGKDYGEGYI